MGGAAIEISIVLNQATHQTIMVFIQAQTILEGMSIFGDQLYNIREAICSVITLDLIIHLQELGMIKTITTIGI